MCDNITLKYKEHEKINYVKEKLKKMNTNPKLKIVEITIPNKKKINIIQDGYLLAGTKQRVANLFIKEILKKNPSIKHLLYAGVINGFGAIASSYGAKKNNLDCTVFLSKKSEDQKIDDILKSRQIITLQALDTNIYLCPTFKEARSLEYDFGIVNKNEKVWVTKEDYYIVPMGMNDDDKIMINIMSKQMKKASKNTILEKALKPRIWVVSGSGGIAMSINKAFPHAEIFILLTGGFKYKKKVSDYFKNNNNVKILKNEKILNNKKLLNNRKNYYNSVEEYDDLLWPYIKKYGQNDDFIWNVSSDNFIF